MSEESGNRSVAMMKSHIKELMEKLAKSEEDKHEILQVSDLDKQKIADEAYRSVCNAKNVFAATECSVNCGIFSLLMSTT